MDENLAKLQASILKLEEERDALRKVVDTRADRGEVAKEIEAIGTELKALRADLNTLKNAPPETSGPETGFWDL